MEISLRKLDKFTKDELSDYLQELNEKYRNTDNPEEIVSDTYYEKVVDLFEDKFGKYKAEVRASAPQGIATYPLPYYIGSLDKVRYGKDEKKLERFLSENSEYDLLCEEKLDGISAILIYINGKSFLFKPTEPRLGTDISHAIPYLNLPKIKEDVVIRAEIVMLAHIFEQKYADEYKFSQALVSGILNDKHPSIERLKDLTLKAYEILQKKSDKPTNQIEALREWGFILPRTKLFKSLNMEMLSKLYKQWKKESDCDIDGIVIIVNKRNILEDQDHPSYAIAFKENEKGTQTEVKYVEWNSSKHGLLKPRVRIRKVELLGAMTRWANGKNARFIENMGIGPGAIIEVVRSGDKIPDIVSVITSVKADFPPKKDYTWNENHVEIIAIGDKFEPAITRKKMKHFTKTLKIKYVGEGVIDNLYNHGVTSILKLLTIKKSKIARIPGLGERSAERIITQINAAMWKIKDKKGNFTIEGIAKLMDGSVCFPSGFGETIALKILEEFPNILYEVWSTRKTINKLITIKGIEEITAQKYVDGLDCFTDFYNELIEIEFERPEGMQANVKVKTSKRLAGKRIVFSGFRDNEDVSTIEGLLAKQIRESGGIITGTVSGKTDILIYKDTGRKTAKIEKAEDSGIEVLTQQQFMKKYF